MEDNRLEEPVRHLSRDVGLIVEYMNLESRLKIQIKIHMLACPRASAQTSFIYTHFLGDPIQPYSPKYRLYIDAFQINN